MTFIYRTMFFSYRASTIQCIILRPTFIGIRRLIRRSQGVGTCDVRTVRLNLNFRFLFHRPFLIERYGFGFIAVRDHVFKALSQRCFFRFSLASPNRIISRLLIFMTGLFLVK